MTGSEFDPNAHDIDSSGVDTRQAPALLRRISETAVAEISRRNGEPSWMADMRMRSLRASDQLPLPDWVATDAPWIDVDAMFAIEARHPAQAIKPGDSSLVSADNRTVCEERGIIFCDIATALRDHPELVEEHLGTVVGLDDDTFTALNASLWSGGSFIYVPPGVDAITPLQTSSGAASVGRFERTLIVADEGSKVHYTHGCSAPVYTRESARSSVVEIVAKANASVTHATIQNWSTAVCNIVTKRANVEAGGCVEWIDGDIGSKLTMKSLGVSLLGEGASGAVRSASLAGPEQHQNTTVTIEHAAPHTTSKVVSRSITEDGGIVRFRSPINIEEAAIGASSHVRNDQLRLDGDTTSRQIPEVEIAGNASLVDHESTVTQIADDQIFYLMSRGLSADQAVSLIVNAFIEPVTGSLPMESAVEWSRLIDLHLD